MKPLRTDWSSAARITNARGEVTETRTEAFIENVWHTIARERKTYNSEGKRTSLENLAGQVTTTAWDCCLAYGYNNRSELTNAVAAVDSNYRYAYGFDDIGNREVSSEGGTNSVYTASQLNQYTSISNLCDSASLREEFLPQFDDDGNQTLIKTATGIWQVSYNGENRPVLWSSCNLKYSGCLATATETLVTLGVACVCTLVVIVTDGVAIPFLIVL